MRDILLIIGAVVPAVSTVIYVRSILQRRTKPHRTTYGLFVLITGLTCASLLAGHDTSGVWLAAAAFAQVAVIFTFSLRFGMGGKDTFDILCLCLCVGGIALWLITGESLIGLLAAIVVDFLALLPALRKMWRHPHTETWVFYAIDICASVSILAAGPYGWRSFLYPLYLALANLACALIIFWRQGIARPLPNQ
jgi:hypothetical protein